MGEVREVPWRRVRPMPDQPRSYFNRDALEELARSVAAVGQVVPALAAPLEGDRLHDYELIDGQRRWHAVQMAGLATLRVEVVAEPDPERRYLRSVVANLSREGHHPMEIARACERLRQAMSVEKVAATLGKSEMYVYQHLRLLKLCAAARERLHPAIPKARRLGLVTAIRLAALSEAEQEAALLKIDRAAGEDGDSTANRAARRVLAGNAGIASSRGPRDDFRGLMRALRRASEALAADKPHALAARLRKRPKADLDALFGRLNEVFGGAGMLLDELHDEGRAARKGA